MPQNLWQLPDPFPDQEQLETLVKTPLLHIERIISPGQNQPGPWYDQSQDEWVVLLQGQATLEYADGTHQTLGAGDYCLIPAHQRHRVVYTSAEPPCLWLAIHGTFNP